MSQHATDALVVYSDYVCPFCYLGKAAMERYREEAADPPEVEWRFYDLRGYKRDESGEIREDVDDGKDDDYFAQESELRERFERAQQAGVSGIPTFVYEGHAARGAIPPEQFERLVDGSR